jgi:hypothetical protein
MPSTWGKRHGLVGYDEFRIGLPYAEAYNQLRVSKKHRYKRRGSVLGYMHELKLEIYNRAVDDGYLEQLEMEEALKKSQKKTARESRSRSRTRRRARRREAA